MQQSVGYAAQANADVDGSEDSRTSAKIWFIGGGAILAMILGLGLFVFLRGWFSGGSGSEGLADGSNASPSEVKTEQASDEMEPVTNESPGDPFSNPDDPKEVFALLRGEWQSSNGTRLYVQADRLTLILNTEHGELAHIMEDITVDRLTNNPDSPNLRGVRLICSTVLLPALGNPDALTTIQTTNEKRIIVCGFDNTQNLNELDVGLYIIDQRHYNDGTPLMQEDLPMRRVALTPSPPSGSELKVLAEKWAKNRATASAKPPSVETKPASRFTRSEQAVLNYQLQGMRIGMSLTEFQRKFPKADFRFTSQVDKDTGIQRARVFDGSEVQDIAGVVCQFYQGRLMSIVGEYLKFHVTPKIIDEMVAKYGKATASERADDKLTWEWDFPTINRRLVAVLTPGDMLKFLQIQILDVKALDDYGKSLE